MSSDNIKTKLFLLAHAGGNVWEYKTLFSELSNMAELIPVELPADAVSISRKGYSTFEEYVNEACRIIKSRSSDNGKALVFGHSFGGYLAHEVAVGLPELINGVVASCCCPYHIYKSPVPEGSSYLEFFGYSSNIPKEIAELFEPLVADKVKLVTEYCEKYKDGLHAEKLNIQSEIIYADGDEKACGSEEWFRYYNKDLCSISCMHGSHFYWHDDPENKKRLITTVKNMIRRINNDR